MLTHLIRLPCTYIEINNYEELTLTVQPFNGNHQKSGVAHAFQLLRLQTNKENVDDKNNRLHAPHTHRNTQT